MENGPLDEKVWVGSNVQALSDAISQMNDITLPFSFCDYETNFYFTFGCVHLMMRFEDVMSGRRTVALLLKNESVKIEISRTKREK